MMRRSALLGLLLAACALNFAHAKLPATASMLINTLSSGGAITYLTLKPNQAAPYMSAVRTTDRFTTQHWLVTSTFPDAFIITSQVLSTMTTTLANGTKITSNYYSTLAVVNNKIVMIQYISGLTPINQVTWYFDTWGRLLTADKKFYLDTSLSSGYTKIGAVPFLTAVTSPTKISQQWVIQQDLTLTPGMNITGIWRSLSGVGSGAQLCLDSGPKTALVLGSNNAPTLKTCNANIASQYWIVIPPNPDMDGPDATLFETNYYPSMFRIYSPVTDLCIAMTPPLVDGGRLGSTILQVGCNEMFAETSVWFNTHGQIDLGARTSNNNPYCLNNIKGVASLGDCSFKVYTNRWQFTY